MIVNDRLKTIEVDEKDAIANRHISSVYATNTATIPIPTRYHFTTFLGIVPSIIGIPIPERDHLL